MTTTIKVNSLAEALQIVQVGLPRAIRASVRDLLRRFERDELPRIQRETWDDGLKRLSQGTIAIRRLAGSGGSRRPTRFGLTIDYYSSVRKNRRARPEGPAFEWAGHLRRATSAFTSIGKTSAAIDPDKGYKGPLRSIYTRPFTSTVLSSGVQVQRIVRVRNLEKGVARVSNRWVREDVIPRLRGRKTVGASFGDDAVSRGEESF